ncbi:MAG: HAMP domain-containing sensor histidine kinase [Sulfuricurvum sp.]|nr:HAMP domain-containing sensor histidine kinase [Sulfuricurvum sp.]
MMRETPLYEEKKCEDACEEIAFLSHKILDLNKQLIESEKAKSRFLSLIGNELNNPMTALLGMIPRLAPKNDEKLEAIFALVHEEALILDFRIQNLVTASEIESGAFNISHSLVDINEIIKEAIETLKYPIKVKNIDIVIHDSLKQKVVTDPQKLYIILKNILANAICYGIADGIVEIIILGDDSKISIAVKNQGKGPDVEYKPQVFTRFANGPDGAHGLGLGLSIVRNLMECLDGSIDYVVGDGTVIFTLTLPLETILPDSEACGSNEFLFESFDGAIEL